MMTLYEARQKYLSPKLVDPKVTYATFMDITDKRIQNEHFAIRNNVLNRVHYVGFLETSLQMDPVWKVMIAFQVNE